MPSPSPDDLLNRPLLRQLAGDKSFARGEEYFTKGHVRQLHAAADRVTARVSGSRTYRVKLWRGRGKLQFSCSCAAGRDETFCKHCVAVGLAWLAGPDGQPEGGSDASRPAKVEAEQAASREQLQRHLRALDKDRLIGLVLEATSYDDILRRRLLLESIGVLRGGNSRRNAPPPTSSGTPDFEAYRKILHEAIACPDYVDYDTMPDYAQGIEEAIYPLADLLNSGHAAVVIELAEFALIELDKANEMVDGGDGSLNPIYDDLQHYHLEACRAARPDPVKLAARLLHYELEGGLGVFNNAAKAYAEILGPRGLAAWRSQLVREWSALPELGPPPVSGPPGEHQPIDHRRFQIQALMERMAGAGGDLATMAAVKQRDLSSAHDFLSLAELYQRAGQTDQAMAWAERGLLAFPGLPDRVGLRDFAAAAYHQLGHHEKAIAIVWAEFEHAGDLEHYRKLEKHVRQSPSDGWPYWRAQAVEHLRQRQHIGGAAGSNPLVEILLTEGADDEAWLEAVTNGCQSDLWLILAERRAKTFPADALRVYQERLGPILARGGPNANEEAASLLRRMRTLFERLGRGAEFARYRTEVRAAHRNKRGFLKLIDATGA